ncbi:MAG: DUF2207 domain-containing protein [Nanoarchaeota archaeon]|nr:DUF2207 domain-containing protein [Nanoarchaeota archaeon]
MKRLGLFFFVFFVFFSSAFSKNYEITNVNVDLLIEENGLVRVYEQLTYSFEGCYSEMYRYIPLYQSESIVFFDKASQSESVLRTGYDSNNVFQARVIFSEPLCDREEIVTYNYSLSNVVRKYDDASEINFRFWGDGWKSVNSLTARITFPENKIPENFWLKPFYGVSFSIVDFKNSKVITLRNIPENQWLEFRALFPIYEGEYYLAREGEIVDLTISEMSNQQNLNLLFFLISKMYFIFLIIPIFIAILVYFKYGVEPKVSYFKTYENEPPTKDSPAIVNALMKMGHGGVPNENGFIATIFDLIRKGYAKINTIKRVEKKFLGSTVKEDFVFYFKNSKQKLSSQEKKILEYLKSLSTNNKLAWSVFLNHVKSSSGALELSKIFEVWKSRVMTEASVDDYYVKKGNIILFVAMIVCALVSAGVFLFFEKSVYSYPAINVSPLFFLVVGICGFLLLLNLSIGPVIFGKRTKKGTLFYKQWSAFKKFIGDYSMIKKYPPESIKLWDYYLVYAIALGEAKTVLKAMKLMNIRTDFDPIVAHPSFYFAFHLAWASGMRSSSSSGFSGGFGGGGFGGGSGGGGGGAR